MSAWLPRNSSLTATLLRWCSTVRTPMASCPAISRLVRPSAISLRMRRSAGVSCSSAGFCAARLVARARRRMRNDDSVGLM